MGGDRGLHGVHGTAVDNRREAPTLSPSSSVTSSDGGSDTDNAPAWTLDQVVDQVVRRVEQRVLDELDRRGRRWTPEVF